MKRRFNFKNQQYNQQLESIPYNFGVVHKDDEGITELTIYGDIGESWYWDSTSAVDVDNALKNAGNNDIVVHLNSPGGSAFDGIAIYNRLKNHEGKVTIHVDGWACSAASVIAMAGDEVIMGAGAMLMIHEASNIVWGSKNDFRKQADLLEKLEDGIIDIYMQKANISREEIRQKVDDETWFSANDALEIGFATSTATSSTVEDNTEVEQLKAQMQTMQNELNKLKNTEPVKPVAPVTNNSVRKAFLNI
ncbi:phage tail protein [Lysinibacillus sp. KCTC 33748]|uniref:head maturation protease, ClpP-related n=1 Tax=unclassified Lysinibacillus TaxID=2636778 RepID=UPI0009A676FF|nr:MULTISPECIES: head maturation protease, ClpP-related [unclassified Lysinibacillus]OXS66085.1 phage tail protein [Lysinibacillus sp. KCTC 33748]SKC18386.1 ATP-dependent protease ClpP, protease subunit [Lysinibacillus sp. AC-3]